MLEVIPTSGLCNKMRAIDSAINFSKQYDIPLKIYWEREKTIINCKFSDLFLPIEGLDIQEVDALPFRFKTGRLGNLYLPEFLRKIDRSKLFFNEKEVSALIKKNTDFEKLNDKYQSIVFKTCSRFFPPEKPLQMFKPNSIIRQMTADETQRFDEFTIGIHIRRTDHAVAIHKSPTELFEKKIEEEIAKDDRVNFYLASDCSDTKKQLVNQYGRRIHTNFEPGDRTTLQGMHRGATELFALSKTKKVYCSFGSSFSTTACHLGGIERIRLMRE